MPTITQTALSAPHFRNLLTDWLSLLLHRYPPAHSSRYSAPYSNPATNSQDQPPSELIELGAFLTHPALQWYFHNEPHNLLLIALPWGDTTVCFGPLAAKNRRGVCPVAYSLQSKDNQKMINRAVDRLGYTDTVWIINTPRSSELTIFAGKDYSRPKAFPFAQTADETLQLPAFCTHTAFSTPHPLLEQSAKESTRPADDLWQFEPALDCNEWKARVQLSIELNRHRPLYTQYRTKLTYEHPQLGTMLPLVHEEVVHEKYSATSAPQFASNLRQLQCQFERFFSLAKQVHLTLLRQHPATKVSPHYYGMTFKAPSPHLKAPPLVISLEYL